jgi:anaerobic ribonucleoside-triphosphate reductase
MYIRSTYDNEFEDFMVYLRGKYPQKLFDLEGIGKQTDLSAFSKEFFATKTNIADKSVDSNANVDDTSIIAYESELPKPYFRLNSLYLTWKYMRQLYDTLTANEAVHSQLTGDIYINDFVGINKPYCYNFSTYDIMVNGLPFVQKIKSNPPKHLSSFVGQIIHFSVYASNSVLGAVGLADFIIVASYYVNKMFKENPTVPDEYLWKQVKQEFQSFIYSCNQPFRGGVQSGFYNISIFDDAFLDKMCSEYIFPDGSTPDKELIKILQELYLDLINETLTNTPLTFPITTACFSIDENRNIIDNKFLSMIAKKNIDYGFINIYCGETSTLSSCCRLRSSTKNEYFNQFGAGGTKIGSLGVVTINIPRIAIKANNNENKFFELLENTVNLGIKINNTKRHLLRKRIEGNTLPLYTLGFMDLKTQYSTIGVVGLNEACKFMSLNILEQEGQIFVTKILDLINNLNDKATKKYNAPHNMEQVPAENSSIKLAQKDKLLGYQSEYDLYSNQFIPLTTNADLFDRIRLQGMFDSKMSGGAICHLNIEQRISDPVLIENLIKSAAKAGVVYQAINYNIQKCEQGHMTVGKNDICSICGSKITDNFTRIVGFLVNTKNFHQVRREQDYPNRVFYKGLT